MKMHFVLMAVLAVLGLSGCGSDEEVATTPGSQDSYCLQNGGMGCNSNYYGSYGQSGWQNYPMNQNGYYVGYQNNSYNGCSQVGNGWQTTYGNNGLGCFDQGRYPHSNFYQMNYMGNSFLRQCTPYRGMNGGCPMGTTCMPSGGGLGVCSY